MLRLLTSILLAPALAAGAAESINFAPAVNHAAGASPTFVAVEDFNGDGTPDLAVANDVADNYGTVSVLVGRGDGTFNPSVSYTVGATPSSVATGDFNGDGKPDLVAASKGSDNVSLLLGNGDGTFQTRVNYAVGTDPVSVAVGDFNGDGKPDLATANYGGDNISVLLQTVATSGVHDWLLY